MRRAVAEIPRESWILFAALPLLQLTISATGPVVPLVREAFVLSYAAVGVFIAALSFTRLAADLPAGLIAARYNGRLLVGISAAATVVAALGGALASEYWQLLATRAILGATTAINQAVIITWLIGSAGARNRGLVMGLQDAGFSTMVIFVPPLSGYLADALSWRAPFVMGAVSAAVAGGMVWLGTRPEQADEALRAPRRAAAADPPKPQATALAAAPAPSAAAPLSPVAAPPGSPLAAEVPGGLLSVRQVMVVGGALLLAAYALTFAVYFTRNSMLNAYLPLLGGAELGLPPSSIGLAVGIQSLLGVVTTLIGGALADRWGRSRMALPGLVLLIASQAALLLVVDVPTFYAAVLFQAVGYTVNALPPSLVGDAVPRAYGSVAVAGFRLTADTAIFIAPLVMGVTLDATGYRVPVLIILAVLLVCTVVTALAVRRVPTREVARG